MSRIPPASIRVTSNTVNFFKIGTSLYYFNTQLKNYISLETALSKLKKNLGFPTSATKKRLSLPLLVLGVLPIYTQLRAKKYYNRLLTNSRHWFISKLFRGAQSHNLNYNNLFSSFQERPHLPKLLSFPYLKDVVCNPTCFKDQYPSEQQLLILHQQDHQQLQQERHLQHQYKQQPQQSQQQKHKQQLAHQQQDQHQYKQQPQQSQQQKHKQQLAHQQQDQQQLAHQQQQQQLRQQQQACAAKKSDQSKPEDISPDFIKSSVIENLETPVKTLQQLCISTFKPRGLISKHLKYSQHSYIPHLRIARRKVRFNVLEKKTSVLKKTISVPKKKTSILKKTISVPKKKTSILEKTISVPKKETSVLEKAISVTTKKNNVPRKKNSVLEKKNSVLEKTINVPRKKNSVLEKTINVPKKKNSVSKKKNSVPKQKTSSRIIPLRMCTIQPGSNKLNMNHQLSKASWSKAGLFTLFCIQQIISKPKSLQSNNLIAFQGASFNDSFDYRKTFRKKKRFKKPYDFVFIRQLEEESFQIQKAYSYPKSIFSGLKGDLDLIPAILQYIISSPSDQGLSKTEAKEAYIELKETYKTTKKYGLFTKYDHILKNTHGLRIDNLARHIKNNVNPKFWISRTFNSPCQLNLLNFIEGRVSSGRKQMVGSSNNKWKDRYFNRAGNSSNINYRNPLIMKNQRIATMAGCSRLKTGFVFELNLSSKMNLKTLRPTLSIRF